VIARLALVAVVIAAAGDARAQDCAALSGPARTDCYIARARVAGQQSGIAAGAAKTRADEAYLRAATGVSVAPRPHRAKARKAAPP
jgi:hypothetical protein